MDGGPALENSIKSERRKEDITADAGSTTVVLRPLLEPPVITYVPDVCDVLGVDFD